MWWFSVNRREAKEMPFCPRQQFGFYNICCASPMAKFYSEKAGYGLEKQISIGQANCCILYCSWYMEVCKWNLKSLFMDKFYYQPCRVFNLYRQLLLVCNRLNSAKVLFFGFWTNILQLEPFKDSCCKGWVIWGKMRLVKCQIPDLSIWSWSNF